MDLMLVIVIGGRLEAYSHQRSDQAAQRNDKDQLIQKLIRATNTSIANKISNKQC